MSKRPEFVKDEHLTFLDELRESGQCNMFGSGSYLANEFPELDKKLVSKVVGYWMDSFGKEDR